MVILIQILEPIYISWILPWNLRAVEENKHYACLFKQIHKNEY